MRNCCRVGWALISATVLTAAVLLMVQHRHSIHQEDWKGKAVSDPKLWTTNEIYVHGHVVLNVTTNTTNFVITTTRIPIITFSNGIYGITFEDFYPERDKP